MTLREIEDENIEIAGKKKRFTFSVSRLAIRYQYHKERQKEYTTNEVYSEAQLNP